jgi:hypothetical protein
MHWLKFEKTRQLSYQRIMFLKFNFNKSESQWMTSNHWRINIGIYFSFSLIYQRYTNLLNQINSSCTCKSQWHSMTAVLSTTLKRLLKLNHLVLQIRTFWRIHLTFYFTSMWIIQQEIGLWITIYFYFILKEKLVRFPSNVESLYPSLPSSLEERECVSIWNCTLFW